MDHSTWLQEHGSADMVASDAGEPFACQVCGTLTEIDYMAWNLIGPEEGVEVFSEACFRCARELLGIEAHRHPLADKIGEDSRTS